MLENVLELGRGFRAGPEFQVSLAAQIISPEFRRRLVSARAFQQLNCLCRVAVIEFDRRTNYGQPEPVDDRVALVLLSKFVDQRLSLVAAQRLA